jgi:hypothetical protein
MAGISGTGLISSPDLYGSSVTPVENLQVGQLVWDGKTGKAFRYILNGASALVKGNLVQEMVEDTTYENMVIGTAGVVGDMFLQVTNGTATITNAQFVGGSISIYTAGTIAICDEYTIMGVTGTLTSAGALKVWLDRPLRAAVTTSARVNMKRSPWSGVIQAPATTATGMICGVAHYEVPALYYGWVQTHGQAAVLSDNTTFAVGSGIGGPLTVAGAMGVYAAGTGAQYVGVTRMAKASAKGLAVFLQID